MSRKLFWSCTPIAFCILASLGVGQSARRPALALVISIDQFRADYLERFRDNFGTDGFSLLLEHGVDYVDCHHRHSITKTAPGHATMLTGVHADLDGIIGNDWIDRATFKRVSCVGDDRERIVGLAPDTLQPKEGIDNPYMGRSPRNLLVTTVGDELRLARGGLPKVIGISNKDRAAILMTGRGANAAYFMEGGKMVTSTYYMKELPAWVSTWDAAGKAEAYYGKTWDRILPAEAYAIQGPDDQAGEDAASYGLGRTFPHPVTGVDKKVNDNFYDALENTPFSNELLEDFIETTIANESLGGRKGITDLLCVSFSANDHIGHMMGPDSQEIMDNVVRMDRTLAKLFAFIDQRVGLSNCVIVLTGDHGAAPMPERVHAVSPDIVARRVDLRPLLPAINDALDREFGALANHASWGVRDDVSILFYPAVLQEKKVKAVDAQRVAREVLRRFDFIQAVYTRDQLERGDVKDALGQRMLLSFNRERSGDVIFQLRPYHFNKDVGTTHGMPYNYDTHVPLVWYGVGVPAPAVRTERVGVDDLAPTLSHILGLTAPPRSEGRVLF